MASGPLHAPAWSHRGFSQLPSRGQPGSGVCLPAVLQLFCSSPKAALRYAAVRTLNKVSSGDGAGVQNGLGKCSLAPWVHILVVA